MALVKYTLLSARRGHHKRGASFTVPVGSVEDLKHRGDGAWSRQLCAPAPVVTSGLRSTGKALAISTKAYLLGLQKKVQGLPEAEAKEYRSAVLSDEAFHMLLDAVLPNGRQPNQSEPAAESVEADEVEEEDDIVILDALDELKEALKSPSPKRSKLLELAEAAGLSLSSPPRKTSEVVAALQLLTTDKPDPTDLG